MDDQDGRGARTPVARLPEQRQRRLEAVGARALHRRVELLGEARHAEPATAGERPRVNGALLARLAAVPAPQAGYRSKNRRRKSRASDSLSSTP